MQIILKKQFKKNLKKLPQKIKEKARQTLKFFKKTPNDKSLRRHSLHGKKYKGCESIDVTGDIRIILNQKTGEIIDIIDIGSHSYLYKK